MAEDKHATDENLSDSIEMLEQILEVMPQDLEALKALYNAYGQCGSRDRAFEYLGLIANIVYDCNDAETAEFVVRELHAFEEEFPSETATQLVRIQALVNPDKSTPSESTTPTPSPVSETEIGEELALAWKLYEEEQLSQEEYSSVLHDLTEVSSKEVDVPVSVLHV